MIHKGAHKSHDLGMKWFLCFPVQWPSFLRSMWYHKGLWLLTWSVLDRWVTDCVFPACPFMRNINLSIWRDLKEWNTQYMIWNLSILLITSTIQHLWFQQRLAAILYCKRYGLRPSCQLNLYSALTILVLNGSTWFISF